MTLAKQDTGSPGAVPEGHVRLTIDGREVEMKIYDDESDATTAQQLYQRLIDAGDAGKDCSMIIKLADGSLDAAK